jgi:hypothetical protein
MSSPQDIVRRNTSLVDMDHLNLDDISSDFGGPKSLENLVYIAQRELISESLAGGTSPPLMCDLPFLNASASSMETTTNSAGSDIDEDFANLTRNRDETDVGLIFSRKTTPVVTKPRKCSSGSTAVDDGYFEMAPPKRRSPLEINPRYPPPPTIVATPPQDKRGRGLGKTDEVFFDMDLSCNRT